MSELPIEVAQEKVEYIQVPKHQLAELLKQNADLKQALADYQKATAGAANVVSFMIDKVFEGNIPKKISLVALGRIAKNLYYVLDDIKDSPEEFERLKQDMDDLKNIGKYLSEAQLKQISTASNTDGE